MRIPLPVNTPRWRPEFGRIAAPWWDTKPVIIVGSGPSLKGFDVNRLQGRGHVLAVKQAWVDLPFADACFGLDLPWMKWAKPDLERLAQRMPLYLAVPDQEIMAEPIAGAIYLRRERHGDRLTNRLDSVESGGNSGFGALNLAVLKRARTIALFGFDYQGQHHDYARYAARPTPPDHNQGYLGRWAQNFTAIVPQLRDLGVTVINASPGSVVDAFPKMAHDETLDYLDRLGA